MVRFTVEVYGQHKLESGEWSRCKVREFTLIICGDHYDTHTKESYIPVTQLDHSVCHDIHETYTTILTERFFTRPFTEYRVTRES